MLAANLLAWPLAYGPAQAYLSIFIQRVPLTPLPFVLSLVLVLAVAWLAVASQALRAVVGKPSLILADEPTGNLDTANGEEVMNLLTQLNGEGTTIVMVTHSPAHADYAQRIVNMLDGAILSECVRGAP